MSNHENLGVISSQDKDWFNRALFIKSFFGVFLPIAFLSIPFLGFLKGLLISFGISLLGAILIMFIAGKSSNAAKILYGGTRKVISLRERLQSVLKTAKRAKMNKEYPTAIGIVNKILEQDPDYYEAMFVKAQILQEGFNKTDSAKKYLKEVIKHTKPYEHVHLLSLTLYEQLKGNTV